MKLLGFFGAMAMLLAVLYGNSGGVGKEHITISVAPVAGTVFSGGYVGQLTGIEYAREVSNSR